MVKEAEIIVFAIGTRWRTLSTQFWLTLLHQSLIHFRGGGVDCRFAVCILCNARSLVRTSCRRTTVPVGTVWSLEPTAACRCKCAGRNSSSFRRSRFRSTSVFFVFCFTFLSKVLESLFEDCLPGFSRACGAAICEPIR